MKKIILSSLMLASMASAQTVDLAQSSPKHNWKKIENNFVEVIYPEPFHQQAVYAANLVEHYSQYVGKTYKIDKPLKFPLILRTEMADPNGFVTLAPRRSEWHSSNMYMPYVGVADWYQILSIHEYRHVIQNDHFNQGAVKNLYYLMGDMGRQIASTVAMPSWYMEGDAVWAETKYTDAGRGRSPRFLERLKALVLSDKLPTYDQFLNGSYQTELPNQYVYGYVLISHATKKYGEDVWERILTDVSKFPQPFRFYSSFKTVTGQSFESFFDETMADLKTKWAQDRFENSQRTEFVDRIAPVKNGNEIFYVKQDLDHVSAIVKVAGGTEDEVAQVNFTKEITGISIGKKFAVLTEFAPHPRYGMVGASELVLVNLKSGERQKLTSGERVYNPALNQEENKIVVTEFGTDDKWKIAEFSLAGKKLNTIEIPGYKVAQAAYIDNENLVAILNNSLGEKSLVQINLLSKKIEKTYLEPSRNLIYGISVDAAKNIVFEAQYKGAVEIFAINSGGEFSKCTQSKIGAYTPSSNGTEVTFSEANINGSAVKTVPLSACAKFASSELIQFKYLGDGPSDSYNKFEMQAFPDQAQMQTKNQEKYVSEDFGDFGTDLFKPHTWGLLLGRGGSLGVMTDNLLRTASLDAMIGSDPEEGQSYVHAGFTYKKYYPIVTLAYEGRSRLVDYYGSNDEATWYEKTTTLGVVLPYHRVFGMNTYSASLASYVSYADTSDYKFNKTEQDTQNNLQKSGASLNLAWNSAGTARSIMAPWAASYSISYDDADQISKSDLNSYRITQSASVQTPSLLLHNGFKFTFDRQQQTKSNTTYRFAPDVTAMDYAFSRGYSYQDVPNFEKVTSNYFFPVSYPDANIPNWFYLKRLYANLFYDSTIVNGMASKEKLNSYSAEILFESKVLRILPLTFGYRTGYLERDEKSFGDLFLATDLSF